MSYLLNSFVIAPPIPIRYIRVFANGSTANASTHFIEIQAVTAGGTNRALNAGTNGRLSQYTGGTPEQGMNNTEWQKLTDGLTGSGDAYLGWGSGGSGAVGILVDLGAIYDDISVVKFWNYYADGRSYYQCTVSISSDNSTYTTILASSTQTTTSSGIVVPVR